MHRWVRRHWYSTRAAVLGAALVLASAFGLVQALNVRRDEGAVAPVALLVTLQIVLVLGYLCARHVKLWLRARSMAGWMRRAERNRLRESLLVAGVGNAAALLLSLIAPAMSRAPQPPTASDEPYVYRFALPDRAPAELRGAVPIESMDLPRQGPRPAEPALTAAPVDPAPAPPQQPPPPRPAATAATPLLHDELSTEFPMHHEVRRALRQWLDDRCSLPELGALMRQGLPSRFDPSAVASPHLATGAILGRLNGELRLSGDVDVEVDLERDVIGEGTTPGGEMSTEIAVGRRDVLRIDLMGLYAHGRGDEIGALVGSFDEGRFSLWWEHSFIGLSHRFLGYERESMFDLAVNVGFAIDMLDASIRTRDGVSSVLDVMAAAPAVGLCVGLWQNGPIGFLVDITQTLPVNVGGQALLITDLRAVMKCDLSERVSLFGGYRSLSARFLDYRRAIGGGDHETGASLQVNGPVFGVDIRF